MFLAPDFFLKKAPKILDQHYKSHPSKDHPAKFCADRPRNLEISLRNKQLKHLR